MLMAMAESIISPIDGTVAAEFRYLDDSEATAAVEAAHAAQRGWKRQPVATRAELCLAMLDAYEAELDAHTRAITTLMGKPLAEALGEVETMRNRVETLCELALAALAEVELPALPGLRRSIRREPLGVVLDIAAWNYPLLVPISVVVGAVLTGNAVLLKHAPQTAPVAAQLAAAFATAGAPPGLVTDFMVSHAGVARVLASGRIDQLCFTGSSRGGREVFAAAAAGDILPVGLELGGKDAAVVLPDCDLPFTVASLVEGAFYNAGQSCCAVERIYVHRSLAPRFLEAYVAAVHELRVGDPREPHTTLGPLVNAAAAERVRGQVDAARAAGARQLSDDARFELPDLSPCYLPPRVLVDVGDDQPLVVDETFGPAIAVLVYDELEEVAARVNASRYGLTASLWTRDDELATRLAGDLEVGTVYQNRCDYLDPAQPWSGTKDSGMGVSLSTLGLAALTRTKSLHLRSR